ncbi:MAG: hypothetical protein R2774_09670 [Saprospiraceae bacterium]
MGKVCYVFILLSTLWFGIESCQNRKSEPEYKFGPIEDYFVSKFHTSTGYFNWNSYMQSIEDLSALPQSSARNSVEWRLEGPGNIGARANTIAIHPNNANIMYLGFSEGGVFKTEDAGISWEPIFDAQATLSIGKITIDTQNPNIIYVGTGDPNVSGYPFVGNGLYKSQDGGKTWQNIGLQETRIISDIAVDPKNSKVLYVGTMGIPFFKDKNRGLYKSIDGGITWQQSLFINDSTGVSNVVIDPEQTNTIYVSTWNRIRNNKRSLVSGPDGGVFKSTDGGQNWKRLEGGLPMTANSRVGIDISKSNPNILYAIIASGEDYNIKGIYKTEDRGESWVNIVEASEDFDPNWYSGFGWYFTGIKINPNDPNDVFVLAVDLYRTKNGGVNWELACPPWYFYDVHADKHDFTFYGDDIYLCTDGGAYKRNVNAEFWEDIENIPTTQFYRVAFNPHSPDSYFGGAQDNGTTSGNHSNIFFWERVFGGDGFQPVFDPTDPNISYVMTQNGGIYVSKDQGQFFNDATFGIEPTDPTNWDAPLVMSNKDPNVLYTGTNKIYRNSTGTDVQWEVISDTLTDPTSDFFRHDISAIDTYNDLIVAGTSDGLVWMSSNAGDTWDRISNLPNKYVSDVHISSNEDIVVTFSSYKDADNNPYIYVSTDKGLNWKSLQYNLPLTPINTVEQFTYPDHDLLLNITVVGTNSGIYWMIGGKNTWQKLGSNFPNVAVYDIVFDSKQGILLAGTFGRGIYTLNMSQVFPVGTKDDSNVNAKGKFFLRPNVVTTSIQLSANENLLGQIVQIYSHHGQLLQSIPLNATELTVMVDGLQQGVHYCKVGNDAKPFVKVK